MTKWVYRFGDGHAEGKGEMRELLGGKGAGLAEMSELGLPVPPGFTITTEVCTAYYKNNEQYPEGLAAEVDAAVAELERLQNRKFGDPAKPLLGLRAFGRARVYAGHDGYRAQSRPQ